MAKPMTHAEWQVWIANAWGKAVEAARAQKKWVGLTDEERGQVINTNFGTDLWQMAKDIEAKLKEKNT